MNMTAMRIPGFHLHTVAAAVLVTLVPHVTQAAEAVPVPDAGSLLRQAQPVVPATAQPDRAQLDAPSAPSDPKGVTFLIGQIVFKGNAAIDTPTLQAQVAEVLGTRMNLGQVKALTQRLTELYRSRGFPLSRVVVPQQDITQGVLTLEVVEARVGRVTVDNEGRIRTSELERLSQPLAQGQAITEGALDRALLLMSDTPGAKVTATIKPGQEVGTSDIVVRNETGPLWAGRVGIDTHGNRYTGRVRANATLDAYNPLGAGDKASLTLLTSGTKMTYGRLAYERLAGGEGTVAGAACSTMRYKLGEELQALDVHGNASACSAWVMHPFVRARTHNLSGRLQLDAYALRDRVGSSQIQQDRDIQTLTASLTGDAQDAWLSAGAVNSWSVGLAHGRVDFRNANAELSDAATAQSGGGFTRWTWNINRLQYLPRLSDRLSLWASASGQGASGNLDSSQKMGLGGPYAVRAYDQGALSGDSGAIGSLEMRYLLGNYQGPLRVSLFYDVGRARINHQPWAAVTGANTATLQGAGVGLTWRLRDQVTLGFALSRPVGARPSAVPQARTGVSWLTLDVAFY
jgi:hemolysin activation/secretion protein